VTAEDALFWTAAIGALLIVLGVGAVILDGWQH
jgi:hypothetical protein